MNIKKQLCNVVKNLKLEYGLTYDQIVLLGEGGFHKSQITSILKHNGDNVSVDVIVDVIKSLGGEIEIHETNRSDLQEIKNRLEALPAKG